MPAAVAHRWSSEVNSGRLKRRNPSVRRRLVGRELVVCWLLIFYLVLDGFKVVATLKNFNR